MKCGHQCFGLCGERCPNICKFCDKNLECINNINDNELIYKTKCGHFFSVIKLDNYFNNFQKNIEIFRCPECNNILLDEPRYTNLIKIFFYNLYEIKNIINKRYININNENNYDKSLKSSIEIIMRIKEQYNNNEIKIFDLLPPGVSINYFSNNQVQNLQTIYNFINQIKNNINFSISKLLTLAEKFIAIEYYVNYHINKKNVMSEFLFLKNYFVIQEYFEDVNLKINDNFYFNLKKKIDNMIYYII